MVKITKIEIPEGALVQSADSVDEYRESLLDSLFTYSDDHLSPSLGYWAAGILIEDIEVGKPLQMMRHIRNDVNVSGLFQTSPIVEIGDGYFATKNSIYKIEEYEETDEL